eukprot:GHVN01058036.1.p1 GENE.GHVN01058036.1~~GHVN01058036.1.p1  ORF type:complete len:921 (-),score=156.41 GHVN01058036.1:341-3103(-)
MSNLVRVFFVGQNPTVVSVERVKMKVTVEQAKQIVDLYDKTFDPIDQGNWFVVDKAAFLTIRDLANAPPGTEEPVNLGNKSLLSQDDPTLADRVLGWETTVRAQIRGEKEEDFFICDGRCWEAIKKYCVVDVAIPRNVFSTPHGFVVEPNPLSVWVMVVEEGGAMTKPPFECEGLLRSDNSDTLLKSARQKVEHMLPTRCIQTIKMGNSDKGITQPTSLPRDMTTDIPLKCEGFEGQVLVFTLRQPDEMGVDVAAAPVKELRQAKPLAHFPAGPPVGLYNLGNTCFMNAALQCLCHTLPLTEYFLKEFKEEHLNRTNPLGQEGKIAEAYHEWLIEMWASRRDGSVTPHVLKRAIGQKQSMYMGYRQQDSHEFVTYLLDGLHEDLNRVTNKELTSQPTGDGSQDDDELGGRSWEVYRKRNDSVIVDNFHGMYRSRLTCPQCHKVSVIFEAFESLSVSILTSIKATVIYGIVPYCSTISFRSANSISWSEMKDSITEQLMKDTQFMQAFKIGSSDCLFSTGTVKDFLVVLPMNSKDLTSVGERRMHWQRIKLDVLEANGKRSGSITHIHVLLIHSVDKEGNVIYDEAAVNMVKAIEKPLPSDDIAADALSSMQVDTRSDCGGTGTKIDQITYLVCPIDQGSPSVRLLPFTVVADVGDASWRNKATRRCVGHREREGECGEAVSGGVDLTVVVESVTRDMPFRLVYAQVGKHHNVPHTPSLSEPSDPLHITDCMDHYSRTEELEAANSWYCSSCKEHVQAFKKIDLWKLPPVLIVHMKRFIQVGSYTREKIQELVRFPHTDDDTLDMSKFTLNGAQAQNKEKLKYKLFGVVNHSGQSLSYGHYTSNVKCPTKTKQQGARVNWKWYDVNDVSVRPVEEDSIETFEAYALFYLRSDLFDPAQLNQLNLLNQDDQVNQVNQGSFAA